MVGLDTIFFHRPIMANFDNQSVILIDILLNVDTRYHIESAAGADIADSSCTGMF